ncbi:MAG: FMN-binding protein [Clostridia bacterium]
MENKKKWAGWLVLTVIVVVAAVALAMTNQITEKPIADRNLTESQEALRKLFPEADEGTAGFESMATEESGGLQFAYTVKKAGETVGYAVKYTVQGYAGPIEVIAGLNADETLRGVNVGGSEFKETEGVGSKAKEPAFTDQFTGKKPPLKLGENIDAISGATITSRAVTDGVNEATNKLNAMLGKGGTPAAPSEGEGAAQAVPAAGRTVNASVMGYAGPVLVHVTIDDGGAITSLAVGAERFMETEGVGTRVKEEAFTAQFVGKKPPIAMGDVDAVSGATVSSTAVVDAVNEAGAFLKQK